MKTIISIFILFSLSAYSKQLLAQSSSPAGSADSNTTNSIFSAALGVQHGFIFAHSPSVENTKGANPTGVEFILSFQRNDASSWELCNCFPRRGLLLAYYNYDTKILGSSYTAAYFLEPVYKITNRSFFSFRGAAGASLLTNPYDSIKNAGNRSYSTRLNAYLLLGVSAWFHIQPQWWLNASLNYQHESNGGMKQPNKGINWPTAGVAISYQPQNTTYRTAEKSSSKNWIDEPLRWDLTIFGIARKGVDANGKRKKLGLFGGGLQVAKQVGRMNNLTTGFEIYRDASLKAQLEKDSLPLSPLKAGISAGHEFILGKFLFSSRLGVYIIDQTPYYDLLFHRWGLMYRINKKAAIGFNLQAHRQVADFIDLRFTYSAGRKRNN
jgi:hypothetical protein